MATYQTSPAVSTQYGDPTTASSAGAIATNSQYSLTQILTIWAAAAVPMAVLGLGGHSAGWRSHRPRRGRCRTGRRSLAPGFITLGLIWQFVLAMILIRRDEGDLRWSTIRRRCWLNSPRDPQTGQARPKLWWWLVPLVIGVGLLQFIPLQACGRRCSPSSTSPTSTASPRLMESDERKAALEGAWQVLALFVVLGIFNTVIGEELLFRGVLLPKMRGAFGRLDWVANGVLFGLYHLHQPWSIFASIVDGVFLYALPSRRFRSAWFGIIVHSMQTVVFIFLALGLVLGSA